MLKNIIDKLLSIPTPYRPKLVDTLSVYSREKLISDILAGIIVAIIALPLAIAFAIASGVGPVAGLWTAVIAGFIISLLGGSKVQIGGPTGAFVVIVFGIVEKFGINGLLVSTFMAGIFLMILGLLNAGILVRFIPHAVVVGFTSGIALLIFLSQANDALGLGIAKVPGEFIEKIRVLGAALPHVNLMALFITLLTMAILVYFPRVTKKIPSAFVALVVVSIGCIFFGVHVETVGERFGLISGSFPHLAFPSINFALIRQCVKPAFTLAMLGAIESLLSAVVADGMTGGRHRPTIELLAQGLANVVSAAFGGMPATGAIARTASNIDNGGTTPVAGLVHALVLMAMILFAGKYIQYIPMSVLSGILIMVAIKMSEWRSFIIMVRTSKSAAGIVVATFLSTVLVDLVFAVEVGMVLAAVLFIRRMTGSGAIEDVSLAEREEDAVVREALRKNNLTKLPEGILLYSISGPLFFGAVHSFQSVLDEILPKPVVLILNLSHVPSIDSSGLHLLRDLYKELKEVNSELLISGVHHKVLRQFLTFGLLEELGRDNVSSSLARTVGKAYRIINKERHQF